MNATIAVVLCPKEARPERKLLGLRLGERVLLALKHSGFSKVAFVGEGPRPESERAGLEEIESLQLPNEDRYWVVSSDSVFDRSLFKESEERASGSGIGQLPGTRLIGISDEADLAKLETEISDESSDAPSQQGFSLRVVDNKSHRLAERRLLNSLRKPIDGIVSTHLNRHISLFLSRFLVKTGLPPNFFTVIFTGIGLLAAYFATQAEYTWALILAGALFQGQSILDGCDGEMARLTYRFSTSGQWMDSIGDDLTNYAVCFGLAIGQARVLDEPIWYWLGGGVLLLQFATSGVLYRRLLRMGTGDLLAIPDMIRTGKSEGFMGTVVDNVGQILKRDSFIFILSLMIVLQHPLMAFVGYALGTIPMSIGVFLNEYRIEQAELSRGV